ncbi:MAG: PhoX family phosphatase [Saprospiraceae bacterium]
MINRRTFLEFLGTGVATSLVPGLARNLGCSATPQLKGIQPTTRDALVLARGFHYDVLIRWDDPISAADTFGFNNDYLAYLPLDENDPDDGLLWVNHEYTDPRFVSGYIGETEKNLEQVGKEMYSVGGSIVRIRKINGKWRVQKNDTFNRRFNAFTEIPFNWHAPIAGKTSAIGTLANCAGGVTPWGTILTCEENYHNCFGERNFKTGERIMPEQNYGWQNFYDHPPEHYGWVVEVDPRTGKAQKHVALGRCAHECATVKELPDGRIVVYSGDDAVDQCLYKFISSEPGSLSKGTLYVANTDFGKWMSLDYNESSVLRAKFKNQTEVLIRLREAARYVGGTPLDRPEDVEIHPRNGSVLIALTNNQPKGNYLGSILKVEEEGGYHDALTFKASTYKTGGEETGFACPDNLAFDPAGNLWFTSDISGSQMNKKAEYLPFKNNGLFVVPQNGRLKGKVVRVASAPVHAELTGPWFSPDGSTLFLSVQHPGEYSPSLRQLASHWPGGGDAIPRPAVVAIQGKGFTWV